MRKLYYEVKVRLGRMYVGLSRKKQKEFYYFSDGYIIISENEFEGILTDDYVCGHLSETDIVLMLYKKEKSDSFRVTSDEMIEISEGIESKMLLSNNNNNEICYIKFVKKITDKQKQKEIEKEISKIKKSRIKQ